MHLIYKHLSGNTTFQYPCFFFLNLIDLFLQHAFLNPPICCLNSCLWPWNSKFMMSSSAFFFFFFQGYCIRKWKEYGNISLSLHTLSFSPVNKHSLGINFKRKKKKSEYFYWEGHLSLPYSAKQKAYLWLTNITGCV